MTSIRKCEEIILQPEIWWHDAVYHAGWETSARQCEWKFGRASGRQAWVSGILYRLYKRLPSSGECQRFLVSQPAMKHITQPMFAFSDLGRQPAEGAVVLWTSWLDLPCLSIGLSVFLSAHLTIDLTFESTLMHLFIILDWFLSYLAQIMTGTWGSVSLVSIESTCMIH